MHIKAASNVEAVSWYRGYVSRLLVLLYFLMFCTLLFLPAGSISAAGPISTTQPKEVIKVVVVAMFEHGEARGDRPGELQFWVERLKLDNQLSFPMGENDLFLNSDGVMAILVGGGIANAAASIMALGLDPRFDLSRTYWLIAGIAGGDPADVSLGSAAWARHVVDGDLLYEIDAREIPEHWPYGLVPLGAEEPTKNTDNLSGWSLDTIVFDLNRKLAEWAFALTRDIHLEDTAEMALFRKMYGNHPNAQRAPFVVLGDTLSASTFWHGLNLNQWANDWVELFAGENANFMTSNMEDSGTLTGLHRLARTGIVDSDRIMVLRTVSNFTAPPPGKSAVWSRNAPYPNQGRPALETAFQVGNKVVQTLVNDWSHFEFHLPYEVSSVTTPSKNQVLGK
ncbi:MAG: purine nucleoside permease [Pseudomonadales bacterium]|nr:purine nucleoside permease [Pseudomonadales bacterium]